MTWWKKRSERLKDEIQAHIDVEIEENVEAGMLREEAQGRLWNETSGQLMKPPPLNQPANQRASSRLNGQSECREQSFLPIPSG